MSKFVNSLFPNVFVTGEGYMIEFKDGSYETSNKDEIEFLKRCGYVPIDEVEKKKTKAKE